MQLRSFPLPCSTGNILPAHSLREYPTMNTLRRCCGTPKCALLSTIHSKLYPNSENLVRMILKVSPLLCDSSPGTFSSRKNAGRLASMSLAISRNRSPRSSSRPNLRPATENGWLFRIRNNQSYADIPVIPIKKRKRA